MLPIHLQSTDGKDDWISTQRRLSDGTISHDGLMVIFNPDGGVEKVQGITNNQLDGPYWEYWANGKISTRGQYRNGKPIGTWRLWDKEGKAHDRVISEEKSP